MQTSDNKLVLTERRTSFNKAPAQGGSAEIEAVSGASDAGTSSFIGAEIAKFERPELTSAKIIVSGGPALGSGDAFHELIEPLADKLAPPPAPTAPRSTRATY